MATGKRPVEEVLTMEELLTRYNLGQYANEFEAQGYDDVRYISTCAASADAGALLAQARALRPASARPC